MGTPEQEFEGQVITTRHIRGLWAALVAAVGFAGWIYSQVFQFATWRSDEEHYKEALKMRLETIEASGRLHAAGQHASTKKQRTRDVRDMITQLEIIHVEIVRVTPAKRRDKVRTMLRAQRDKLTDSLIE